MTRTKQLTGDVLNTKALLCAVAGGVALVPGAAQAGVIHYGGAPIDFPGWVLPLNLNNDDLFDFDFGGNSEAANGSSAITTFQAYGNNTFGLIGSSGVTVTPNTNDYQSLTLNSATVIQSGYTKCGNISCIAYSYGNPYGSVPNETDYFLGLTFYDAQQARYNGWALISTYYTATNGEGVSGAVVLKDYAYTDNQNATLQTGSLTEVPLESSAPEPASLAMMAFGAAGLAAMRARRKQ